MWCRFVQLHLKHQICSILGKRVQIRDKAIQVLYFIIQSYLHKFQTCKPPINREDFSVLCVCIAAWPGLCVFFCYSFKSHMLFCDFDRLILFMFSADKITCPKRTIYSLCETKIIKDLFVHFISQATISHILGKWEKVSLCIRSLDIQIYLY